jgi:hypothetical protein
MRPAPAPTPPVERLPDPLNAERGGLAVTGATDHGQPVLGGLSPCRRPVLRELGPSLLHQISQRGGGGLTLGLDRLVSDPTDPGALCS